MRYLLILFLVFVSSVGLTQSINYDEFEIRFDNFEGVTDSTFIILNNLDRVALEMELIIKGNIGETAFPEVDFSKHFLMGFIGRKNGTYNIEDVVSVESASGYSIVVKTCETHFSNLSLITKWILIEKKTNKTLTDIVEEKRSCVQSE